MVHSQNIHYLSFGNRNNFYLIKGVYRRSEDLELFIDINDVDELRSHSLGNELVIGANVNLTETMDILTKASTTSGFEYCKQLVKHIDLIANVPVRNVGFDIYIRLRFNKLHFFNCIISVRYHCW